MSETPKRRERTRSEEYLAYIATETFLSLWCYPEVFRNQGKKGAGDGKELCDLLVVFGDDVVIFSDKSCAFPDSDLEVAWARWFRRAIWKSAQQVRGAERWLREHPNRVFRDPRCEQRLPVPIPEPGRARFHRVVVAVGARDACRRHFGGGNGSLLVVPAIEGEGHFQGPAVKPFAVGVLDAQAPYVHVFDDLALDVVLTEMSTVTDLIRYLSKKEKFLKSGRLAVATGEEDLVAYYLKDIGPDGDHDFVLPKGHTHLTIDESYYYLRERDEYKAKEAANQESYFWDKLIEHFAKHAMEGTLEFASAGLDGVERSLRTMASESRLERRSLSHQFLEKISATEPGAFGARVVLPRRGNDLAYALVIMPRFEDDSYEDYRAKRSEFLKHYCMLACFERPEIRRVVGLAVDARGAGGGSEDLVYYAHQSFTDEERAALIKMQARTGLLANSTDRLKTTRVDEYPTANVKKPAKSRAQRKRERRARRKR